jgi:hypothetical protein
VKLIPVQHLRVGDVVDFDGTYQSVLSMRLDQTFTGTNWIIDYDSVTQVYPHGDTVPVVGLNLRYGTTRLPPYSRRSGQLSKNVTWLSTRMSDRLIEQGL